MDHLLGYDGPADQFLRTMLEQVGQAAPAEAAAVVRIIEASRAEVLAYWPDATDPQTAPAWLATLVEIAGRHRQPDQAVTAPFHRPDQMYGVTPSEHAVITPLRRGGPTGEVSDGSMFLVFKVNARSEQVLAHLRDRLELMTGLLAVSELRAALAGRSEDLERLRGAMEIVAAIGEQPRFQAAAMALCNQIATRFDAERVSLGFLRGRYIKLRAMSHTEKFTRKMKLAQAIEATMEECCDQDVEVLHPSAPGATFVNRAARELSDQHGPTTVLSLPLRQADDCTAVLTIERRAELPWRDEEVQVLRLTSDLATPWLAYLHEKDRWFGARWADGMKQAGAALVGPTNTWAKLLAVAVTAFLLFAIFARGTYRVDAPFVFKATQRQIVPMPFDSYLTAVHVEPDVAVFKGQLLAELDTVQLMRQRDAALADRAAQQTKAQMAMRDGSTVEKQIAEAEIARIDAQLRLIDHQINRARILAPIDGVVLTGDHEQNLGAAVQTGDVLFELAPLRARPVRLTLPRDTAADLLPGMRGTMSPADFADEPFPFTVELVDLAADTATVTVRLLDSAPLRAASAELRSGSTGTARVRFGEGRPLDAVAYEALPIDTLVAELHVRESDINDIEIGDRGYLAASSYPGLYIGFEVIRISPVAEVVKQSNVFRVKVRLLPGDELEQARAWVKPGIEGLARVNKGKRRYISIWTRELIDWVRMKLWI